MENKPKPLAGFLKLWKAGAPLISIDSADPAQTINNAITALNGRRSTTNIMLWDCVAGLRGTNLPGQPAELGQDAATLIAEGTPGPETLTNPVELLALVANKAPGDSLLFLNMFHRFISETPVVQALWNCRDTCKARHVVICCLGTSFKLPPELVQDFVSISEDLPGEEELGAILDNTLKDADLPPVPKEDRPVVIDTLRGVSAFCAENTLAASLSAKGVDKDSLWNRKVRMIEQTPGLSVWRGQAKFDDLGGLDELKGYLSDILTSGNTPIRAIGFMDEIEKVLGNTGGDTSNTSQDQLSVVLKVMQDYDIPGITLLGHPGTGKSAIAKAAGSVAGAPVISFDMGAMKDSLVGSSEARIRAAMDVFRAVSEGKGFFIATCNAIASLPPELRRRFRLGTFFVDLPTKEEREKIWPIWLKRYGLASQELPDCDGWTGAEVAACCDIAYRTGRSLKRAAMSVCPVCRSAPEKVEALRRTAHNKFLSATTPGFYRYNEGQQPAPTGRKMEL